MSLTSILEHLPSVASQVGVYRLDPDGMVLQHSGASDASEFRADGDKIEVDVPAGRAAYTWRGQTEDEWWVVTYAADQNTDEQFSGFLCALFTMFGEKSQLESDMESMHGSSLALLEEVSMVGDVMPKLPTGESEAATAAMVLDALMVASSVHRAIYARFDPRLEECEIMVHRVMDREKRMSVPATLPAAVWSDANQGLVGRAIHGSGAAIMESVLDNGRLGVEGSPEWYAEKEIIAAPVRYGDGEDEKVLGVVCIMDKQATAYSNATKLGSQESKMATAISSIFGLVLGTRRAAELGKEMKMAKEIQQQILPKGSAQIAGYEIAGHYLASGLVGGDYFDYLPMADGRTLAVVADVSGHNVASGMLMVSLRATLRSLAMMHAGTAEIFTTLGQSLFEDLHRTERFITAAGVTLSSAGAGIELVNAGHNDTMIYRRERSAVESIPSSGPILGFIDGVEYPADERELSFGDVLILYTDGITEATNSEGVMYEEQRLAETLQKSAHLTAQGILDSILSALVTFTDKSNERDDVTLVVIKRTGDSAN